MITWKNMDTLASYQALATARKVDLKAAMSGENDILDHFFTICSNYKSMISALSMQIMRESMQILLSAKIPLQTAKKRKKVGRNHFLPTH